jgi:hypothetical protein
VTRRKAAATRIRSGTLDLGTIDKHGAAPPMPRGLCRQAQDAWRRYWGDPVSGATLAADLTVVFRWVANLDAWHRVRAAAAAELLVAGSKGQMRLNPLWDLAMQLERAIRDDERALGIGPRGRLQLGLSIAQTAATLDVTTGERPAADEIAQIIDDIRQISTDSEKTDPGNRD